MTATPTGTQDSVLHHHDDSMSSGDLRRRGLVLLAGAVLMALFVKPIGALDYYWLPLLVGLTFTAAAAATGPRSPLWGAGLVVGFWGLAKVFENNVEVSWAGPVTTIMLGMGALAAAYLATRGFAVSALSVAWPVLFIGVGQLIHSSTLGTGVITWFLVGLTAVYGVAELVNSSRRPDVEHTRR